MLLFVKFNIKNTIKVNFNSIKGPNLSVEGVFK